MTLATQLTGTRDNGDPSLTRGCIRCDYVACNASLTILNVAQFSSTSRAYLRDIPIDSFRFVPIT